MFARMTAMTMMAAALAACQPATAPDAMGDSPSPAGAQVLNGTEWQVELLGGEAVLADSTPTISFAADENRVAGHGSCNRFMGSFEAGADGALGFGELASTMMACPEALMQQEDRYMKLLGVVQRYQIVGGALVLSGADGELVRAHPAAAD